MKGMIDLKPLEKFERKFLLQTARLLVDEINSTFIYAVSCAINTNYSTELTAEQKESQLRYNFHVRDSFIIGYLLVILLQNYEQTIILLKTFCSPEFSWSDAQ